MIQNAEPLPGLTHMLEDLTVELAAGFISGRRSSPPVATGPRA
jgi:hypothetical protein